MVPALSAGLESVEGAPGARLLAGGHPAGKALDGRPGARANHQASWPGQVRRRRLRAPRRRGARRDSDSGTSGSRSTSWIRPIAASAAFTGAGWFRGSWPRAAGSTRRGCSRASSRSPCARPCAPGPACAGDLVRCDRDQAVSARGHDGERHPVLAREHREPLRTAREQVLDLGQVSDSTP